MTLLLWLLLCFLIIPPLKQWISIHLQGLAFLMTGNIKIARWVFWFVLLPGTCLHEFSHWLMARLLFVKTYRVSLWPEMKQDGWMQMGAVHVHGSIDPFRHSLIGLAPLIFGSFTVLFIGQKLLAMDNLRAEILNGNVNEVAQTASQLLGMPITWLWLYLIFAISNSMFPSTSDRQAWRSALLCLGVIPIIAFGFGYTPHIPLSVQTFSLTTLASLLFALSITIIVDLLFIGLIGSVELMVSWMMGRQVIYNR